MTVWSLSVSAIAALLLTSAAQAATIANRDNKDVKVRIVVGNARQDIILQPGKVVEGVCQKGCILRLDDNENDEYELDGSRSVSIEEGFLYDDGVVAGGAPSDGAPVLIPNVK